MNKKLLIILWIVLMISVMYVSIFYASFLKDLISKSSNFSIYLGYALFLLFGSLRNFTFIPSSYLIAIGLLFFKPIPLYIISLIGILVSAILVYYFFEKMDMRHLIAGKYKKYYDKIEKTLVKNEFPIVFFWSMAPFLPTDIICYACGIAKVNIKKFILAIFLGEGIICAIYIFFGSIIIDQLKTLL